MTADLSEITWPPLYKIRRHKKAKYVRIYPSDEYGLQITVPYRFNLRHLPPILEKHKNWICEKIIEFQTKQTAPLPEQIIFPAFKKVWTIQYLSSNNPVKVFERATQEIVVMGKVHDQSLCKKKLTEWLKDKAKIYLTERLKLISEKIKLPFETVAFRDQKTRWGSCAADKSINLNYKLILLPDYLIDHVIIHELCHTKHLNHSEKFWQLVAHHDATWQMNRRELRHANQFIPGWL